MQLVDESDDDAMADFALELLEEDYRQFTEAEWKVFFAELEDEDDIVDFVNEILQ